MSTSTSPMLRVFVRGDSATVVDSDGGIATVTPESRGDVRQAVVNRAAQLAHERGHAVEVATSGDRGEHHLLVDPDGHVSAIEVPAERSGDQPEATVRETVATAPDESNEVDSTPAPPDPAEPPTSRASFIDTEMDAALVPSSGIRGWLRQIGLVRRPSAVELERRRRIRLVSAQWAGPRTIAVVNGKGGVGKTPTTAMLAAVYARYGGGPVLAFDNNDTRGTLGWRTEQGNHGATITDLLASAPQLANAPTSAMAAYIHHQTDDRYDVLRSNPRVLSAEQRLTTAEFDTLVNTVSRGYRVVVFDSGNDESADRWLRMVDWAHQLVVPTLASPESAESAALLLEALAARDERSAELARAAVVVITQAEPAGKVRLTSLVHTFRELARAVTVIPFDPALKSGALRFGALHTPTQHAWIESAAHAAERF